MTRKHRADWNFGKNRYEILRDRLTCLYPLSICERLKYPYFCILIIKSNKISFRAKRKFIREFVIPYTNDITFQECSKHYLVFTEDDFIGNMESDEIEIHLKNYIEENKLPKETRKHDVFILMYDNYHPNSPYSIMGENYK